MHVSATTTGLLAFGVLFLTPPVGSCAEALQQISPVQLVREVVFNELHDHQAHGYWRYLVEKRQQHDTRLEEQIETADGPVTKLVLENGHSPTAENELADQARLSHLLTSPADQARLRQEHSDDERRIGRILALLPEAFLFGSAGYEGGLCHLRFSPNPDYPAHGVESRVFHAMSGDLWIDIRLKHLVRLDGQLQSNVDFGYGILGRLNKGGWFRLRRVQVDETNWKTERLEVHMSGRALLLKTIALETSEIRSNFFPVPARLTLAQGIDMVRSQSVAEMLATSKIVSTSYMHRP